MMHIFHQYREPDYGAFCGNCYRFYGHCPHGMKVCQCRKFKAYGSCGRLTCVPDTCKLAYRSIVKESRVVSCGTDSD